MLITYFLPDLFPAIPASIDERRKVPDRYPEARYRTRILGYDALMEMILCRDAHTLLKLAAQEYFAGVCGQAA
jgi:hypothetical protein